MRETQRAKAGVKGKSQILLGLILIFPPVKIVVSNLLKMPMQLRWQLLKEEQMGLFFHVNIQKCGWIILMQREGL
jgi:hypothetical protein